MQTESPASHCSDRQTLTYLRARKQERPGTTHKIVTDFKSWVDQRQSISSLQVLPVWLGRHCPPSTLYSRISQCNPGMYEATRTAWNRTWPQAVIWGGCSIKCVLCWRDVKKRRKSAVGYSSWMCNGHKGVWIVLMLSRKGRKIWKEKKEGLVDPEHPPHCLQELGPNKKLWLRTREQEDLQPWRTFLIPFFMLLQS